MARDTPSSKNKSRDVGAPDLKAVAHESHQAESATPSPKRQRITRRSASGMFMNYDMKYHPMDDILRPAASAARKAAHGLDTRRSSTASDSTTFVEDAQDPDRTDDGASLKPSPEIPQTHVSLLEPFASLLRRPIPPRSGSPSARRITRAEVHGERPVLYDMRHHPMDVVIRPAAAKRVYEKYSSVSESTSSGTILRVARPPNTAEEKLEHSEASKDSSVSPSAPDDAEGLDGTRFSQRPITTAEVPIITPGASFTLTQDTTRKPATSLWKSLSDSERLMFLFQKGAPVDSSTLPVSWDDQARALQALFGIDASTSATAVRSQVAAIRNQYAGLHRRLQEDFGADPEPSKMEDWTLHYAEDFGVYDLEVGDKYFQYRGDGVVQPPFHRACDWTVCKPNVSLRGGTAEAARDRPDGTPSGTNTAVGTQARRKCADSDPTVNGHTDSENHEPGLNANESDGPRMHKGLRDGEEEREAGSETGESGDDHGHGGPYNDAEGYLRQSRARYDDDLLVEDGAEDELIASMQNPVSRMVEDVMGISELAPMLRSSSSPHEDEDSEPVVWKRPLNRRSRKRATGSNFSVHEDEAGSTPRIKRQVAMNPRSPGTDIPKENLRERSASEELGS
ncbi:MAG: hypothetical protein Q9211_003020 [Gyalolechia sp. 1 TL-2023]